ncbi:hypothetical protein ACB092_07G152000 [Castanea dentata]
MLSLRPGQPLQQIHGCYWSSGPDGLFEVKHEHH